MTTLHEALQQAAEYVDAVPDDRGNASHIDREKLVEALKTALAQQGEPVAKALMDLIHAYAEAHGADMSNVPASDEASTALKAALAQQGGPVAWAHACANGHDWEVITTLALGRHERCKRLSCGIVRGKADALEAQDGTCINEGNKAAPQQAQDVPETTIGNMIPKPPNESGETMCVVRWILETPHGWLGAYDKRAFSVIPQPLSDDEIDAIMQPLTQNTQYSWRKFARAIEVAHGIKEVEK